MKFPPSSQPTCATRGLCCKRWVIAQQRTLSVKMRDELAVAVEHLSGNHLAGADHPLLGLAPARMRHIRVDVRFKWIFGRLLIFPERVRLLFHELDPGDRLGAFVAI